MLLCSERKRLHWERGEVANCPTDWFETTWKGALSMLTEDTIWVCSLVVALLANWKTNIQGNFYRIETRKPTAFFRFL